MTERELDRHAAHRLAIIRPAQELTGNVAKTCRYYGISRQVYYKWLRRYEEGGLDALRDRSSRPHVSPKATRVEVVGKIIYLRQTYHFGPHKIAMYLKRYLTSAQPVGDLADAASNQVRAFRASAIARLAIRMVRVWRAESRLNGLRFRSSAIRD